MNCTLYGRLDDNFLPLNVLMTCGAHTCLSLALELLGKPAYGDKHVSRFSTLCVRTYSLHREVSFLEKAWDSLRFASN